jgi:LacI family transcriptional regulator
VRNGKKIPRVIIDVKSERESDRRILAGIAKFAAIYGPWEFIMKPLGYTRINLHGMRTLWYEGVQADAIFSRGFENIDYIRKAGIPAVISGVYKEVASGFTCLKTDSQGIAEQAAEHLIDCGFVNYAFCGFSDIDWSMYREAAFAEIIENNGHSVYKFPALAPELTNTPEEKVALTKWLISLPKPVGIMACNDDRGWQVIEAAKMAGILVPDEVAVLGVDNDSMVCGFSNPPLSSIDVDFETAGFKACKMLSDMIHSGKHLEEVIRALPTGVEHRRSTDTLIIPDESVVRALQFIRQHPTSPLQVADVAEHCGLSRRVLEKRFRTVLNRSVFQELKKVRVKHLCKLLTSTNEPVTEIASRIFFTDFEHFSRYFKSAVGVSPTEYRKKYSKHLSG